LGGQALTPQGYHVGGTGPAGPHRPAGCSCPSAQAASRQIFWRTLIARNFTQRSRVCSCHASSSLGRARQAQAPTKVYPVGRIVETRFRDRDSPYEVQGPAPPDRTHQERGHRKEDSDRHASAQRGTQAPPRAPAARLTGRGGSWGAGQRELAELTGASAGCKCGRLCRMLGTHLSGRCARGQIRLTEPGVADGRGGPRREGSPTQKNPV